MLFQGEVYEWRVSAAGRVNLIGEHIDYCGGKVLPVALSLCNTIYVRPNGGDKIRLRWTDLPHQVELDPDRLDEYENLPYGNYYAGCAKMFRQAGHRLVGCDMLSDCTVPFGAGLSSSAAIEVSTLAALSLAAGEDPAGLDRKELALLAQRAEREYAHVNCGIMDQYAAANGKKDHALLLDCAAVAHTDVPLILGEYTLVITNCNKPHRLVESKYNERRAETDEALRLLQQHLPVEHLAQVSPEQLEQYSAAWPEVIRRRARHVVAECGRVEQAAAALHWGDLAQFGRLLNASHRSLRELYEVTGKELDVLADAAQAVDGCLGSRMTGGGFGGSTVSLVRQDRVAAFEQQVAARYTEQTGYTPSFYTVQASDGICIER